LFIKKNKTTLKLSPFTQVENHNMKNNNVKIKYDSDADVLSMEAAKRTPIAYAQEMGDLIVHFSESEEPILIEMLDASKTLRRNRDAILPLRDLVSA